MSSKSYRRFPKAVCFTYSNVYAAAAKSLQSCPTLCDPIDSSPPGSSIHGIFQARVLEWGAIAFSECICSSLKSAYSLLSSLCPKAYTLCLCLRCILFVHSSVDGRLDCLHFLSIMSNVAVNICIQVFVWYTFLRSI